MHTDIKGDLVGTAIVPTFNKEMALFLYQIELRLLFNFASRQADTLKKAYDGEAFIDAELMLLRAAMTATNKASDEHGDLPKGDPDD